MNWKKIDRKKRIQYKGIYSDWKQQIADECYKQCVYCSIHESPWGGIDHYHIDHFRPQSKFPSLANTITNLYYACPICNKFKSNNWPNEPDHLEIVCYPDPSDHDYTDLFYINPLNYTLEGKYVSSRFLINRMYLNRPQLIYERREYFLKIKAELLIEETKSLIEQTTDIDLTKKALLLIAALAQHLLTRANISPYKLIDIKKLK